MTHDKARDEAIIQRLMCPPQNIRPDLTIAELAEVVLMLSSELTNLKKRVKQLEENQYD